MPLSALLDCDRGERWNDKAHTIRVFACIIRTSENPLHRWVLGLLNPRGGDLVHRKILPRVVGVVGTGVRTTPHRVLIAYKRATVPNDGLMGLVGWGIEFDLYHTRGFLCRLNRGLDCGCYHVSPPHPVRVGATHEFARYCTPWVRGFHTGSIR